MTIAQEISHDVPERITSPLRAMIRRTRLLIAVRGLAAVVVTTAAALLAAIGIDALVPVRSATGRWVLTMGALAPTVIAAIWMLLRPLGWSFTLRGTARMLERRHPELQERISSTIELLSSGDAPSLRGSQVLIDALATQAGQAAGGIRPGREATVRSLRAFLLAAGITAGLIGTLFALWPGRTGQLITRVLVPRANIGSPAAAKLICRPDGDRIIPRGHRQLVELVVRDRGVDVAAIDLLARDGRAAVRPMAKTQAAREDGYPQFIFRCPPAVETFRYRLGAGRGLSRVFTMTVADRAELKRIDLSYDYPAYTDYPPREVKDAGGDMAVLVGTKVTITVATDHPITSGELRIGREVVVRSKATPADAGSMCRFQWTPTEAMTGTWSVTTTQRLAGRDYQHLSKSFRLTVLPDRAPSVKLIEPRAQKLTLQPTDRVPIGYVAADDYGIAAAEVLVWVNNRLVEGKDPVVLAVEPATEVDKLRSVTGQGTLDLAKVPAAPGGSVKFCVRVRDNRPAQLGGPQEAMSDACTITLKAAAPAYTAQRQYREVYELRLALRKILTHLKAAVGHSGPLVGNLSKLRILTPEDAERMDHVRGQVGAAATITDKLLKYVPAEPATKLRTGLEALGGHVTAARKGAAQMRVTGDHQGRYLLASQTHGNVQRAIAVATRLLADLVGVDWAVSHYAEVEDLAGRQAELARKMQNPRDPGQLKDQQNKVVRDLQGLVQTSQVARKHERGRQVQRMQKIIQDAQRLSKMEQAMAARLSQMKRPAAGRQSPMPQQMAEAEAKRLRQRQQEMADRMQALAKQTPKEQAAQQAAQHAKQAAQQANRMQPKNPASAKPAAQAAKQAAQKMQQLAKSLGAPTGKQPQSDPKQPPGGAKPGKQTDKPAQMAKDDKGGKGKQGDGASGTKGGGKGPGAPGAPAGGPGKPGDKPSSGGQKGPQGQPGSQQQLGRQAAELAAQQQKLAEQFKAFAENRGLDVLAQRHAEIRSETLQTKEDMERMYVEAPQWLGAISGAPRIFLQRAISAQWQLAQMQAQPNADLGQMVGLHNRAAKALGEVPSRMYDPMGRRPIRPQSNDISPATASQLSEALDAAGAAARTMQASQAQRAANALGKAAQGMGQAMAGMGMKPGKGTGRGMASGMGTTGPRAVDLTSWSLIDTDDLKTNWGRLHGKLRSDILQGADQSAPAEYRTLIKRYFEELARRGVLVEEDEEPEKK